MLSKIGWRLLVTLTIPVLFHGDQLLVSMVSTPLKVNGPLVNLASQQTIKVNYTSGWQILTFQPRDNYAYNIQLSSGGSLNKNLRFPGGNTSLYSFPFNFQENGFQLTNTSVIPDADSIAVGQFGLLAMPEIRWKPSGGSDTIEQYQSIGFQTPTSSNTLRFRALSNIPALIVVISGDSIPEGICLNWISQMRAVYTPWLEAGLLDTTNQSFYQASQHWEGQSLFIFNASPFPSEVAVDFF